MLDRDIIRCVNDTPGLNIAQIQKCLTDKHDLQSHHIVYHRVKTLKQIGFLKTEKGYRNEKKVYLTRLGSKLVPQGPASSIDTKEESASDSSP